MLQARPLSAEQGGSEHVRRPALCSLGRHPRGSACAAGQGDVACALVRGMEDEAEAWRLKRGGDVTDAR